MAKKMGIRADVVDRLLAITGVFWLGVGAVHACSANLDPSLVAQADSYLAQNKSIDAFALMYPLSKQGSGGANQYLALMYEQGRGLKKSPFMVRHLNWMGAQDADPVSMFRTAVDFYDRGYSKDGEFWAKRSHECGNEDALVLLVEKFINSGREPEAITLIEQGLERSIPRVKYRVAEIFDKGGLGFEKDHQKAFTWYFLAAKDGIPEAMSAIGFYFALGIHGVQDDVAAIHWYFKAAKSGYTPAITAYAWMLANGKGAQVDRAEAKRLFLIAASKGDANARRFISEFKL